MRHRGRPVREVAQFMARSSPAAIQRITLAVEIPKRRANSGGVRARGGSAGMGRDLFLRFNPCKQLSPRPTPRTTYPKWRWDQPLLDPVCERGLTDSQEVLNLPDADLWVRFGRANRAQRWSSQRRTTRRAGRRSYSEVRRRRDSVLGFQGGGRVHCQVTRGCCPYF
jgi:hypothetical protein